MYSLSISTLKSIEFLFRLFSKSEINWLFECNLKTCHVPKERTKSVIAAEFLNTKWIQEAENVKA